MGRVRSVTPCFQPVRSTIERSRDCHLRRIQTVRRPISESFSRVIPHPRCASALTRIAVAARLAAAFTKPICLHPTSNSILTP